MVLAILCINHNDQVSIILFFNIISLIPNHVFLIVIEFSHYIDIAVFPLKNGALFNILHIKSHHVYVSLPRLNELTLSL